MSDVPANGVAYRLLALEARLSRIENLEPAVMRQEIRDVKDDLHQMVRDVASLRKLFMGFIVTFSITSISIVVLILTNVASGKP